MAVTDYYLLDYIGATGTQRIDSGFKPSYYTNVECIYMPTAYSSSGGAAGWTCPFGTIHGGYYYRFLFESSGNAIILDFNQKEISYSYSYSINNKYTILVKDRELYMNSTKIATRTEGNFNATSNLYIFSEYPYGTGYYTGAGKMYSMKIWQNSSTLARNFVPAKRKSDNVLGLYDLVENKFYTNVGSGSFTGGSTLTGSISVSKNINEAGNISGGTGNKFPDGSIGTTLNATTNNGYHFLGWYNSSGQLVSTNTSYTYIGPEGASFVAKYAYLDNIVKPNKSLSPINFDFNNTMNGLQFRKWDSPISPLILDMGANNASGSYRQVFIIGGDSINIYSCCIFTQGDDAYAKKTSLDTTNTTYSATKVGNLLTINFSDTIWGPTWVLWN